ncbi:MAG: phosphopantothenoylcysteine decarboxylase, partial [Microlunatus sp.]|nr:phosphopantothenoylcysteine decarboxylase [Microlunatus sp.]
MWWHRATQDNVATLRSRGAMVLDPDSGRLTGADSGPGRLPDPAELAGVASAVLRDASIIERATRRDLGGLEVTVSAGGTREHLDPVRFLGNRSSGLMGWALARAAVLRGADVHLVAANVALPAPPGAEVHQVTSTADLATAMTERAATSDLVVMAAAPADFTPATASLTKIKKDGDGGLHLDLVQTVDVLASLVQARTDPGQVLVGFAAETPTSQRTLLDLGRAKLSRKGCDLLVLNEVGEHKAFGRPDNEIVLLSTDGADGPYAGSKDNLAHLIWDAALRSRARQ